MQAFVSDLPKNVFHKNIFIDRTEKRNTWEGSLKYELRLKHELGFLFGSGCSGICNLEKLYENIPPTQL